MSFLDLAAKVVGDDDDEQFYFTDTDDSSGSDDASPISHTRRRRAPRDDVSRPTKRNRTSSSPISSRSSTSISTSSTSSRSAGSSRFGVETESDSSDEGGNGSVDVESDSVAEAYAYESVREWLLGLKAHVNPMLQYDGDGNQSQANLPLVRRALGDFCDLWDGERPDIETMAERVYVNFQFVAGESWNCDQLDLFMTAFKKHILDTMEMLDNAADDDGDIDLLRKRVNKSMRLMEAGYNLCKWTVALNNESNDCGSTTILNMYQRCEQMVPDDDKPGGDYIQFLDYVYEAIRRGQYRLWGTDLYRQVFMRMDEYDRYQRTYAWTFSLSVESFVRRLVRKQNPLGYNLGHRQKGLVESAVKDVENTEENAYVPDLRRDRHVFAFRNGIYFAEDDTYTPFVTTDADGDSVLSRVVYPPGSKYSGDEPIAANFFDLEFHNFDDFRELSAFDIPTPAVDRILNYQGFDLLTQRIFWILIGRCLYDIHEYDDWAVVLCLFGLPETGKSKLLKIPAAFYDPNDVGVLVDELRRVQGLEGMADKFVVVAEDITRHFFLSRSTWQLMVDGAIIQEQGMYKKAKQVPWKVPTVYGFNEQPYPKDDHGSVARRQGLMRFDHAVLAADIDKTIEAQIRKNMPAILLKANRHYRSATARWAKKSFWKWCSPHFRESRASMQAQSNPWSSFLNSEMVAFGDHKIFYITLTDLVAAFRTHCTQTMSAAVQRSAGTSESTYMAPFAALRLIVEVVGDEDLSYPSFIRLKEHGDINRRKLSRGIKIVRGVDTSREYNLS